MLCLRVRCAVWMAVHRRRMTRCWCASNTFGAETALRRRPSQPAPAAVGGVVDDACHAQQALLHQQLVRQPPVRLLLPAHSPRERCRPAKNIRSKAADTRRAGAVGPHEASKVVAPSGSGGMGTVWSPAS